MSLATSGRLDGPLPITILTGFLGSGKTTILRELLRRPEAKRTAVVINEVGSIGLDHLLALDSPGDTVLLLEGGCVCCTVRDDLILALRRLFVQRSRGEIPRFDSVIVETTGLADPTTITQSLLTDTMLQDSYRLDGIVTVVDAVMANTSFDAHTESLHQVALADHLLLTKTDLVEDHSVLEARLRSLNPGARIVKALHGQVAPSDILGVGYLDHKTFELRVSSWIAADAYPTAKESILSRNSEQNIHAVQSFSFIKEEPLSWKPLVEALSTLTRRQGHQVLRVKGIVNIEGQNAPLIIHGVRWLMHPTVRLEQWPDLDRRSRMVIIAASLEPTCLSELAAVFRSEM